MQAGFSAAEVERYSRQMLLPQVGVRGQERMRAARILIVGMGGLGCPAALYLAGAGVGTLGLVDRPGDVVEQSNLHRQIAHTQARVGTDKVASMASAVKALNPLVAVEMHREFVRGNAVALVREYDIVLDCTDNVAARYLVNDACAAVLKPLISGSAIGLEGQLTVYLLNRDAPCYRCIFPEPPPPSCVGSCASAGVLGPVPGTIGTLQALEAIKVVAQIDGSNPLSGRMLLFDASEMNFRNVKLRPRVPSCKACAEKPSLVVASFDYDMFARGMIANEKKVPFPEEWRISASSFSEMRANKRVDTYHLVDVRSPEQFDMCALPEAQNVPLDSLRKDNSLLSTIRGTAGEKKIIVLCRRGNMSQDAVRLLRENGVTSAVDVIGGLQAWHNEVDASFPMY